MKSELYQIVRRVCFNFGVLIALLVSVNCVGAEATLSQSRMTQSPQWRVKSRDGHQTKWYAVSYRTNQNTGQVVARTNSYIELATGLNVKDSAGRWQPANPSFTLTERGAESLNCAHRVRLAHDINSIGSVEVKKEGMVLRNHPLCITYYDPVDTRNVVIAEITNAVGYLTSTNEVVYSNCFNGLRASMRYRNSKAGLEADLILHEQPLPPETYGLSAESRIELITEFSDDSNVPTISDQVIRRENNEQRRKSMLEPDLRDSTLSFGAMRMGPGKAFALPSSRASKGATPYGDAVPVGKRFTLIDDRKVLIEGVRHRDISHFLERLPQNNSTYGIITNAALGSDSFWRAISGAPTGERVLPAITAKNAAQTEFAAKIAYALASHESDSAPGFVLDYQLLSYSGFNNFVFQGGTTYLCSGIIDLYETTTIMAGAVVKYEENEMSVVQIFGPVECRTEPYAPAFFTSIYDNTVGEVVSTAQNPNRYFQALAIGTRGNHLKHLRISYAEYALHSFEINLRHSQITHCTTALYTEYGPCYLGNVLIHDVGTVFSGTTYDARASGRVEHVTIDGCSQLTYDYYGAENSEITIVDSLLAGITEDGDVPIESLNTRNLDIDHESFQSSGGGTHYLPASSPYRGAGGTSVNADLINELANTTTFPPTQLFLPVTATYFIQPVVTRNSPLAPDLGYAYDVIDFTTADLPISGTLIVTNGSVLARSVASVYNGVHLLSGGKFIAEGTPKKLSRIVDARSVQETGQPQYFGTLPYVIGDDQSYTASTEARFRFASLAGNCGLFEAGPLNDTLQFSMRDCQVVGGRLDLQVWGSSCIGLTNNLMLGTKWWVSGDGSVFLWMFNNTFIGGQIELNDIYGYAGSAMLDNLFDRTPLSGTANATIPNAYYITMPPEGDPANVILTAPPEYQNGPLGAYYAPNNPAWKDNGSQLVSAAGLVHHTIQSHQQPDTGLVDMGFHYVMQEPESVGYWGFDEATGPSAMDASGHGQHGTWWNGPISVSGRNCERALFFDGVDDYVIIPNATHLEVGKGGADFSVLLWVKLTGPATGNYRCLIHKGSDNNYARTFGIWMQPNVNKLGYAITTTANWNTWGSSEATLEQGQWYHIAYVKSGDVLRLFINGILDSSVALTSASVSNSDPIYVGKDQNWAGVNCVIDDLRICPRALITDEIAAVCAGSSYDVDGDGLPDYLEDSNGNGIREANECNWQSSDTDGDGLADGLETSQDRSPLLPEANLKWLTPVKR